jgi:hypothetical protein
MRTLSIIVVLVLAFTLLPTPAAAGGAQLEGAGRTVCAALPQG